MAYIRILGSGVKSNPNINYAALADFSSAGGTKTPAKSLGTKGAVTAPAGQPKTAKKAAKGTGASKAPIVWFFICFVMTVIGAGVQFGFPVFLGASVLPSQALILLGITLTFLIPTTVLAFLSKTLLQRGWSLILLGAAWAVTMGVTTAMTFYGLYPWYVPLGLGIAALIVVAGFVLRYFLSPSFKEALQ